MRTPLLRYLLPLALLVAVPLLDGYGRARAGYITPASLVSCPHSDFTDNSFPAYAEDMGPAATASDSGDGIDSRRDDNRLLPSPSELLTGSLNSGLTSTGAGSQTPPDGPGAGGSNQLPCVASQPLADAPLLVGFLFLDRASNRPPTFPSRLFRPPRLS